MTKGLTAEQKIELIPERTILLGYRGSVAHGTYTKDYGPNSHDDKDLLGVCVGPTNSYIGLGKFEQREKMLEAKDGVVWDSVVYELRKFVRLLLNGNPNVMTLLWLPEHLYIARTNEGQRLIDNRDIFASRDVYHSYVGYAKGQLHRMTHPDGARIGEQRRTLIEKFGYDCKNAGHLIRLLRMGIEFLSTGELKVNREDATELIEIKRGERSVEWIEKESDRLFALAQEAFVHSPLPPKPDYEKAERLTMEVLSSILFSGGFRKGISDPGSVNG